MSSYEYTVIPAPARGEKSKAAKTGIERFAATLSDTLNEMAQDGWDYVRAETLPAEERAGLTSRTTVYHNLLIFRRSLVEQPSRAPLTQSEIPVTPPVTTPPVAPTAAPSASTPVALSDPAGQPATAARVDLSPEPAPVRAPFSQPMRSVTAPQSQARPAEPPLTRPQAASPFPAGPRLGPATR